MEHNALPFLVSILIGMETICLFMLYFVSIIAFGPAPAALSQSAHNTPIVQIFVARSAFVAHLLTSWQFVAHLLASWQFVAHLLASWQFIAHDIKEFHSEIRGTFIVRSEEIS